MTASYADLRWLEGRADVSEFRGLWRTPLGRVYAASMEDGHGSGDQLIATATVTYQCGEVLGAYPELGNVRMASDDFAVTYVETPRAQSEWVYEK
jgi:hypothetical protein